MLVAVIKKASNKAAETTLERGNPEYISINVSTLELQIPIINLINDSIHLHLFFCGQHRSKPKLIKRRLGWNKLSLFLPFLQKQAIF